MQDSPPQPSQSNQRRASPDKTDSFFSLLSAAAFGYFGFYVGLRGASQSWLYNASVDAFTWMSKGLAIGLLLVALSGLAGFRPGLLLDAILSGLAMVACLLIGVIWLVYGDSSGILILILGGVCGTAARGLLRKWRS